MRISKDDREGGGAIEREQQKGKSLMMLMINADDNDEKCFNEMRL